MIVARIQGGLGNQLFQYAFGTQLASRHGTELVLDLSSYTSKPDHGYMLDRFSIGARELRADERKRVPSKYRDGNRSLLSVFKLGGNQFRRLRERPFGFSEKYMSASDNSYLVGYWQSDRFFRDVIESVQNQFRPAGRLSHQTQEIRERMLDSASIAIHFRRGDYITTQPMAVRNLGMRYYQDCVRMQLEKRPESEVYVFSNDIAWCRENLKLPCPIHFVDHTKSVTAHEDLWLMTAADCMVIANSTFSWWGAYLSERLDRTVYAPMSWFLPGTMNDQYLNCANWIRVADSETHRKAA